MPEGDTLFRIASNLRKAILGQTVTRFSSPLPHVAEMYSRWPVAGRTIAAVEARGKNLLIVFRGVDDSGDLVLHTHLRMTGSWHIHRHGEVWRKPERYARVVIETEPFIAICFSAPTVELMTAREAARHSKLAALGPDAMTEGFDPAEALARLRARPDLPIGVAIMAQSTIAGIGNEFKSEILFICRVNPFLPVSKLSDDTLTGMIDEAHKLLRVNESINRRRTRFELDPHRRLWVYNRAGQPCAVCGGQIDVRCQGLEGRTTYYCANCQNVELPS